MNLCCRRRIKALENAVEAAGPAGFASGKPVAQILIACGSRKEAVQKGAEVESGASGDNRNFAARDNVCQDGAGATGVFAGRE
jgi:hypothetical protein